MSKTTNSDAFALIASALAKGAGKASLATYDPHPKQILFHSSDAKVRQFLGGNRSGKTVGGAVETIHYLRGESPFKSVPPAPVYGRAIGVDFLQGVKKIIIPKLQEWMPPSLLKNGSWEDSYSKQDRTLTCSNGSQIEFMSYDQELEKFAGTSRHFIWFDEEPPEDIFNENRMRTVDVLGDMWLTMTPVEGMTWTFDEIFSKSGIDPAFLSIVVDIADNHHIAHEEIEDLLGSLSEDEKKARLRGEYVSLGGTIYKDFGDDNLIDPMIPPVEWMHFRMMDHGYNNPTAWLWAAVNSEGEIIIYDEHYESDMVVREHAKVVNEKTKAHKRQPFYSVGDPSIRNIDPITGTSIQLEYIENGIPIVLGNNDVQAGIVRTANYFKKRPSEHGERPRIFITRNCVNLIHELKRYRWETWANKKLVRQRNKKEAPLKKDDHACDALRYGIMSRPAVNDTGKEAPEVFMPIEASVASQEEMKVEFKDRNKLTIDPYLGSEW